MPLLPEQERRALQGQLEALAGPVTLLFFAQTIAAPETVLMTRQILNEVVALNDYLSVREVNVILEKSVAAGYGITHIPAIALLRGEEDTRIRFLGAPTGYEFVSLIQAIMLAGRGESGLSAENRDLMARHVTGPMDIKVFSTPTCPHCPRAVTLAHRMAIESPLVTATCIEATEFPDLSLAFRVTGVPKTVVNGIVEILGALPEDDFVRSIVLPEESGGDSSLLL